MIAYPRLTNSLLASMARRVGSATFRFLTAPCSQTPLDCISRSHRRLEQKGEAGDSLDCEILVLLRLSCSRFFVHNISRLCEPVAATTRARLAHSCPQTSAKSTSHVFSLL